jgi:hypothetical protein
VLSTRASEVPLTVTGRVRKFQLVERAVRELVAVAPVAVAETRLPDTLVDQE